MELLQLISIVLEAGIALMGAAIGLVQKKWYGWCLALTFLVYVYYDAARLYEWTISQTTLHGAFFVATVSAFFAVWGIYKRR